MRFPVLLWMLLLPVLAVAQVKKVNTAPSISLLLKMEFKDGTNASAVVWSPDYSKYYAVVAGNEGYGFNVFKENGTIFQSTYTNEDVRGLWYNTVYKTIEANTYKDHSVVSYLQLPDGSIVDEYPRTEIETMPIPQFNAVVTFDYSNKQYVWFDPETSSAVFNDIERGSELRSVKLILPVSVESINSTTIIYTGIKGGELGLLNYTDGLVYLFNAKSGKLASTIQLPSRLKAAARFCFSYANNHLFLYDISTKTWTGLKII